MTVMFCLGNVAAPAENTSIKIAIKGPHIGTDQFDITNAFNPVL